MKILICLFLHLIFRGINMIKQLLTILNNVNSVEVSLLQFKWTLKFSNSNPTIDILPGTILTTTTDFTTWAKMRLSQKTFYIRFHIINLFFRHNDGWLNEYICMLNKIEYTTYTYYDNCYFWDVGFQICLLINQSIIKKFNTITNSLHIIIKTVKVFN